MTSLEVLFLFALCINLPSGYHALENRLSPREEFRPRFQNEISPIENPGNLAQTSLFVSIALAGVAILISTASVIIAWVFVLSVHFKYIQPCRLAVGKLDRCIWLMERRMLADDLLDRLITEGKVDVRKNDSEANKILGTLQ
ncbi:unnamed protein product [Bursaphelenchus xylophilus]|uniref:(pine wood nematode) hypothetical protein n=1 Tax=Bursaphelenchus xylophilus TaxID=6326 RepID=A0A1I7S5J5_BURXY|nr:unnamed protein product [Bursaphelenchus xylophilus]CAG9124782.1 unnamed protein product [Bursaphelenchus xylophilus]